MWKTKLAKSSLMVLLMLTTAMAGCIGGDDESSSSSDNCSGDELKIAYEIKEDLTDTDLSNPQQIADYLCDKLDMDVSLYDVGSS